MRRSRGRVQRVSLAVLFLLSLGGCAVEQGQVYTVDSKSYCVASGIWRDKWWQNYERGLSCADGQFWDEAIASFRAALTPTRGQTDRWRVNTYGVRFIEDYFPHRELGMVYYQLGRHEEAQRELELSLTMTETAKAKFYLNKVRSVLIQQAQRDTAPPRILLETPPDNFLTNRLSVVVKGQVEDDTYVQTLVVNGREQFVELAAPRLPFTQEVPLQDGVNAIDIEATDLSGQHTRRRVQVSLDRHGPTLSLQQVEPVGMLPQRVRVQGALSDRSGLKRFVLAGRDIQLPPGAETAFAEEVPLAAGTTAVPFEAEDAAGNVTRGAIALGHTADQPPAPRQGTLSPPGVLQWAALHAPLGVSALVAASQMTQMIGSRDSGAPVIKLGGRSATGGEGTCRTRAESVVFENSVLLEIEVTSGSNITRVAIDGQPLPHSSGKQLFFAETMPLQLETNNGFVLEAVNARGKATQCEISIKHEVQKSRQIIYRLKVLQGPFEVKDLCERTYLVASAEEDLFKAFMKRKRFNIRQISNKVDDKKNLEADGFLKSTVCQGKTKDGFPSFEVWTRFLDVDPDGARNESESQIREDVYGEGIDRTGVEKLMEGLSLKVLRHFPLVEGHVSERRSKQGFVTSLTKSHHIRPEMKLIVFREERRDDRSDQHNGRQEILGEARITEVHDKFSEALGKSDKVQPQPQDKVVTK